MLGVPGELRSNSSLWNGQQVVLFDVARSQTLNYAVIESIKNGLLIQTKYEVMVKSYDSPHVIIFANTPPLMGSLSEDRWNVINDLSDSMTLHMLFPPEKFPSVIGLPDPFEDPLYQSECIEWAPTRAPPSPASPVRAAILGSPWAIPLPDSQCVREAVRFMLHVNNVYMLIFHVNCRLYCAGISASQGLYIISFPMLGVGRSQMARFYGLQVEHALPTSPEPNEVPSCVFPSLSSQATDATPTLPPAGFDCKCERIEGGEQVELSQWSSSRTLPMGLSNAVPWDESPWLRHTAVVIAYNWSSHIV